MAKSLLNSGIEQLRGTLDQWVYKVVRGQRVIARRPRPNPNRVPTQSEIDGRERFRQAAVYGRAVLADSTRRVVYEQVARARDKPVFALIIGDYYTPPKVDRIDLAAYHGAIGQKVVILASDDIKVTAINVAIRDNGTHAVVESGAALLVGAEWHYTATTALPANHAVTFEVTARDMAGNETTGTKVYP